MFLFQLSCRAPSVQLHNTGCRGADTPCVELHQMLGLLHSFNNGVHHQKHIVSCNDVDSHNNLDTLCPLYFYSMNKRWIGYLKCKNKLFVVTSPRRMTLFLPNTYRAFQLLSPYHFGFMVHNFTAFVQFHCTQQHGFQINLVIFIISVKATVRCLSNTKQQTDTGSDKPINTVEHYELESKLFPSGVGENPMSDWKEKSVLNVHLPGQ